MIKAIAIDDELPALQIIDIFCSKVDFLQLDKTFNKPTDALKYINKYPVDLLFLDINMPSLTGIELYKNIRQETMVIFTTAYSDYAVEGFNLNAIDFLLKPFTFERFLQAANKAAQHQQIKLSTQPAVNYIYIRADYSLIKIDTNDILFIEGLDDYLKIHLRDQKPVVARMTLKSIVDKLPEDNFVRIHRSYVAAIDKISSIRGKMISIAGEDLPVSSSYEENFLKRINK
jgi:DNA-binding LytR/AlgR family response regulator